MTLPGVDGKLSWMEGSIFKRGFCNDLVGELAYIGRASPLFSHTLKCSNSLAASPPSSGPQAGLPVF